MVCRSLIPIPETFQVKKWLGFRFRNKHKKKINRQNTVFVQSFCAYVCRCVKMKQSREIPSVFHSDPHLVHFCLFVCLFVCFVGTSDYTLLQIYSGLIF